MTPDTVHSMHSVKNALCIAVLTASASHAGTVEQASIFADPQMQVKSGEVQGCGYRLKAIPQDIATAKSAVMLDASFNLYSKGTLGLLKGGALQLALKDGELGKPVNKPIESFWVKVQGEKPTAPTKVAIFAAETKGYLLYGVSLDTTMSLFKAVWDKVPIMIGMRLKGEPFDRIYSGTAQVSDQDNAQVHECMNELIKQMQADLATEMEKKSPER